MVYLAHWEACAWHAIGAGLPQVDENGEEVGTWIDALQDVRDQPQRGARFLLLFTSVEFVSAFQWSLGCPQRVLIVPWEF